jgi:hypothetical protein
MLGAVVVSMGSIARADSGLLRKQSSRHRSNERRIVEPNRAAAAAVDALSARLNGEIAVSWNDRGTVQAVYGKLDNLGASSEQAARVFLSRQSDLFSLRADLADLTLVAERETPGGRCVDFQQDYMGVKVYDAVVSVAFDREDNVSAASGKYFDAITLETVTPNLTPDDARSVVVAHVRRAEGIEPLLKELVVYVDDADAAHLAYHVIQPTANKRGAAQTYETFVDATSGELLVAPHDVNQYATGQVYKNGNAMAATGNSSLKDTSSVPSTAYQTVTLLGATTGALKGPYCDPTTLSTNKASDASGNYVYTRSTTVSTGSLFDEVNLYYYIDDAQRYIQSLGFTNVNNRVVRFNVNGTTDDNSWYSPNGTGTGDLTTGSGGVDDAEDGEVMLHEYGHSIQDNSRPGAWGTAQAGAMGEGFGDYWAASVTSQRHGQRGTAYETTVMEWDASSYSSAVPPTIRSITSTKHYPESWANEVHADGEMWSSTLWQIRSDFIALDGFPAGAQNCDKVVLQSHFLVPASGPTFADGSNALITAATNLGFNTAHTDAIRNRCSARGFISGGGGGGCSSSSTAITSSGSGSLATTDCASTVRTGGTFYYDNFTFSATAGTTYTITLNSTAFDTYLYLLNGSTVLAQDDDGNGGTNSKITYTAAASGTLTIHCTSYAASKTGAYTVTLAGSGGGGGGTELVGNGGFESGTTSWTFSGTASVTAGSPQAGTNKAQMLGVGSTATGTIYQPIAGFNGTARTLRFYLKMSSAEGTTTAYDKLYVRITSSSGTTLTTLGTYTNVNKNTYAGWVLVTVSIPATYAAAGNRLTFYATEDTSLATTFYLDGVSIQ